MEDHACLTLIQNSFPRLTDVEKKVAAYLLANGKKVVYMTVSELAEATGVAPSGIIRFCKRSAMPAIQTSKSAWPAALSW
ncbi:MAG: MurR/RpiR family transcriptional regulator [Hydrogeniiclostridium mannosilyticum]